jgi:hypothetical protein
MASYEQIFLHKFSIWLKIKPHPNVLPVVGYIRRDTDTDVGIVSPYVFFLQTSVE